MKPLRFVLAPKVVVFTFVSLIFFQVCASAQSTTFALLTAKNESIANPPAKSFNAQIRQLKQDQLLFQLLVENPGNERLTLYIKDKFNNTLHREALPANVKFEGRYNLQSLEDGDYVFEIRNGKNIMMEKSLSITTQTQVNRNVSVN
jgi:hypothetical protein